MSNTDSDTAMRSAAFAHVRNLSDVRDCLTASDLAPGFQFGGVRIPLINPQRYASDVRQDVATDEVREASRSHACDSPVPGRVQEHEQPGRRRTTDVGGT